MTRINAFQYPSDVKPFCLNARGCHVAWSADCGIVIDCMLACVFCMFEKRKFIVLCGFDSIASIDYSLHP